MKAALVSDKGKIIRLKAIPTPSNDATNFEEVLFTLVKSIIEEGIVGIGIGVAGILSRDKNKILASPNIEQLKGFPLKDAIEKEFSVPVLMENDADVYACGEKWIGVGQGFENFVLLTLGTGIGAGIFYKGKLFDGPTEIGHMVVEPEGNVCSCGNIGCFEAYASGWAIMNRTIDLLREGQKSVLHDCCQGNFYRITPEMVYKTALKGDSLCRGIFRDMGRYLGCGISSLINIFGPEAVILGGGLSKAWDLFIKEIQKEISRRTIPSISDGVKILRSSIAPDGGAKGAASLLFQKYD